MDNTKALSVLILICATVILITLGTVQRNIIKAIKDSSVKIECHEPTMPPSVDTWHRIKCPRGMK